MNIWTYQDDAPLDASPSELSVAFSTSFQIPNCPFCNSQLTFLHGSALPEPAMQAAGTQKALQTCQSCGWWVAFHVSTYQPAYDSACVSFRRACGTLVKLDVSDLTLPTEELRKYLIAKYQDRYTLHPQKFEEIVGAVYADYGYRVRVTSYSGDEGIDVAILDGEGGETAGIQVKRYRGNISAEQIRAFTGALFLKGMTSGIFVTTSSFQKGAHHVKSVAQARGMAIELVDSKKFYDALRITQRPIYTTIDDPSAPFFDRWRNIQNAPIATQVAW